MRIWTIQPAGLFNELRSRQVLLADGRHCYRHHKPAYEWMIGQMRRRLPPSRTHVPWWGWYRWEGTHKAKPDLRTGGHLPTGRKGVRIELDVDATEILLSDYIDWHYVLNNWFLASNKREGERFDRECKRVGYGHDGRYPKALQSRVHTSWEHIFDLGRAKRNWLGKFSARSVQATFWELRLNDVRGVTFYTDRG